MKKERLRIAKLATYVLNKTPKLQLKFNLIPPKDEEIMGIKSWGPHFLGHPDEAISRYLNM